MCVMWIRNVTMSAEKRLIRHLLETYSLVGLGGRPVLNASHTTLVRFGLGLINMDLDETEKVLVTSMWIKMVSLGCPINLSD